jgi:trans-aconitate 2-methyltransferase
MPGYAFGDSALARERLAIVADTFEVPTRTLLADLPAGQPRYVLDLGCGPGHTSALLRQRFPHSEVTGVDGSPAMIDEARDRVTGAWFCVADVTEPLRLPADVVYARLLLGHLPDPRAALEHWVRAVRPPGLIVCEEPVRYRSENPLFVRYESAVTGVVGARGATLWGGTGPRSRSVGLCSCAGPCHRVSRSCRTRRRDVLAQRGDVAKRSLRRAGPHRRIAGP